MVIKTYFGAVVVKRCDVSTCYDRSWSRMSLAWPRYNNRSKVSFNYYHFDSWSHEQYIPYCIIYFHWLCSSVLCRMKMLPVMILVKYHSSARSAVSESPNSSARLVSQCPNSSARLVSQCPNSSSRLVFPMFQVELATRFWIASSKCVYLTVSVTVCLSFV